MRAPASTRATPSASVSVRAILGADTISSWIVDWGDGTTSTLAGSASEANHVYASAVGTPNVNVQVEAYDEDGGPYASQTHAVQVIDRAPLVRLHGDTMAIAGQPYRVDLAVSDPGGVTVNGWTIDWGDGTTSQYAGVPTFVTHTFSATGAAVIGGSVTDAIDTYQLDPFSTEVRPAGTILSAKATAVGGTRIAVEWSAVASGNFAVQLSTDGANFAQWGGNTTATEGHLLVDGLQPQSTYWLRVVTSGGTPATSNVVQVQTLAANVVYQNDFEGAIGDEWSTTQREVTPETKTRFLGQFNNTNVDLTLGAVPQDMFVDVAFDLYVIRSWDGSDALKRWGPEYWNWGVEGNYNFETTFSNHTYPSRLSANDKQHYPLAADSSDPSAGTTPSFTGSAQNSFGVNAPQGWLGILVPMDAE